MQRILASHILSNEGARVRVRGWLHNLRAMGKVSFLILRDRSGLMQVVIEDREELKKVTSLHVGTVLTIEAEVVRSSHAALGCELVKPCIRVESGVTEPPPLEYYKPEMSADLDTVLDYRPVALRNRRVAAVFKIQAEIAHAYRLYMHDAVGAVEYFAPNMIGASSEGGAEFFKVDYFGHTATLAQSSQLYKQMMVGVYERVFALMPFFRAEKSNTSRHLTEGKQLEFEMGFFERWQDIMDIEEGAIKSIVAHLRKTCAADIEALGGTLGGTMVQVPESVAFPRVSFAEAQQIYFERTAIDERAEPDLSPNAERELCRHAHEKFGTDCIFITDWKTSKRPFYAYPTEGNPELTNTFDLLCGGTEITSGGQRRHTYDSMLEGIKLKQMEPADFEDYLSIFKFGMPPHGGFGIGLERLTMTILGLQNIREATLFPSDPKRIAGRRLKAHVFFGAENLRNEIIRQLRDREVEFQHLQHEATPTSEDSARVRGTKLEEGVKALILRGKSSKKNYMVNLPSNCKVDMKAVAEAIGERCEFEDPKVIEERFGVGVGGVPPFGNLLNLPTWFDEGVAAQARSAFNCGMQTESIVIRSADLVKLVEPKLGKFAKV